MLARRLMRDPVVMMERAYLLRTNKLARPFQEYPLAYLHALLLYGKDADDELGLIGAGAREDLDYLFQKRTIGGDTVGGRSGKVLGPPKPTKKHKFNEPILTGDPIADEWERQIARGETPDFDMGL